MENGLLVRKIRHGTVIDHIPAWRAPKVLRILGLKPGGDYSIAVLMNVESRKIGRKDIVKVSGVEIPRSDWDKIALIAPEATINIVRDYRVVEKEKVSRPREVKGILRCINPTCITRQPREPVEARFIMVSREPLIYKCMYCGSLLEEKDILEQLA